MSKSFSADQIAWDNSSIQFDDANTSKPNSGLRDIALSLAHHIFGPGGPGSYLKTAGEMAGPLARMAAEGQDGMAQVAGDAFNTIKVPVDLAQGALAGAKREDFNTSETLPNQLGQAVGRYGPPMAATLAASAAAPIVAPAAMAAAPLLTGAAAAGVGAASGDLASMAGAKALGGEAPEGMDALKAAGATGLEAAGTDLGLGIAYKALAAAAPKMVAMFKSFPKEALKRTMARPDEVLSVIENGGARAQAQAEEQAVGALRQIQNGLTMARKEAGKAVESALNEFHAVTQGQKLIQSSTVADAGAEALANRSTEAGVSALTASEQKKVLATIKELQAQGPLSARDAVIWRRKLDNLIDYNRGSVPEIQSGEGQGIIAGMAKELRNQIGEVADSVGFTRLAESNRNFGGVANTYDSLRPSFSTKTTSSKEAVRRLKQLQETYYSGGLPAEDLTNIGKQLPILQKPMDRLLDAMAAREFTLDSKGSPSGPMMTAIRFVAGPDGLATAANFGRGKAGAVKKALTATAAGGFSKANQK